MHGFCCQFCHQSYAGRLLVVLGGHVQFGQRGREGGLDGDRRAWQLDEFYQRRVGMDEVVVPAIVRMTRQYNVGPGPLPSIPDYSPRL